MRKTLESYRTYSIPDKTEALVPEFAVEESSVHLFIAAKYKSDQYCERSYYKGSTVVITW